MQQPAERRSGRLPADRSGLLAARRAGRIAALDSRISISHRLSPSAIVPGMEITIRSDGVRAHGSVHQFGNFNRFHKLPGVAVAQLSSNDEASGMICAVYIAVIALSFLQRP